MFDGSSIGGWKVLTDRHVLMPDPVTALIDPFYEEQADHPLGHPGTRPLRGLTVTRPPLLTR